MGWKRKYLTPTKLRTTLVWRNWGGRKNSQLQYKSRHWSSAGPLTDPPAGFCYAHSAAGWFTITSKFRSFTASQTRRTEGKFPNYAKPGTLAAINKKMQLLSIIPLLLLSCVSSKSNHSTKIMEFKSGKEGFKLEVPDHWTYYHLQGVDSYVGAIITHKTDTIYFDLRRYSSPLDHHIFRSDMDENEENYRTTVALKVINGYNAKFATHSTKSSSDYGIHFDSLWTIENTENYRTRMKLTIYGFNLSQRTKKQLEKSVRTIEFIKD